MPNMDKHHPVRIFLIEILIFFAEILTLLIFILNVIHWLCVFGEERVQIRVKLHHTEIMCTVKIAAR